MSGLPVVQLGISYPCLASLLGLPEGVTIRCAYADVDHRGPWLVLALSGVVLGHRARRVAAVLEGAPFQVRRWRGLASDAPWQDPEVWSR